MPRLILNPWAVVDIMRAPWLLLDGVASKLDATGHHVALDKASARAAFF
jgi:hypothetical protein